MYVCLFDKQGRAGAVTLAFPSRYLLATPHKFLDQLDGSVCLWLQTGQGRGRVGQGRGGYACISKSLSSSNATQIFGPIRWFCLSMVTNRAGQGQGRARQGRAG